MMLSMTERSHARLAMVLETRSMRGGAAKGARSPVVRRYRLVRMAPLAGPVASRFAQMRAIQE